MKAVLVVLVGIGLTLVSACTQDVEEETPNNSSGSEESYDPKAVYRIDSMPTAVFSDMLTPVGPRWVAHTDLSWKRQVLTVAFENGDPRLFELIEAAAHEWTNSGGELVLSFRNNDGSFRAWSANDLSPVADIRISFRTGNAYGGYWSVLGNLAENMSANEPTMNLEGFDNRLFRYYSGQNEREWKSSYDYSTILHEFGHALGIAHEHFHPQCQDDMLREKVVSDLMSPPNNWSREQAEFNYVLESYVNRLMGDGSISINPITSTNIDQESVMLYYGSPANYQSGVNSPCLPSFSSGFASSLSQGDREYFLSQYENIPSPF